MARIGTNKTNGEMGVLYPDLSYKLVGCIYKVRNTYGNGQKEKVYQNALAEELDEEDITYQKEAVIQVRSPKSGKVMGTYRVDYIIGDKILVELKAIKFTPTKIEQQIYSYLKSTPYELGFLVNFGATRLYLKRVIFTNDRKPYLANIS